MPKKLLMPRRIFARSLSSRSLRAASSSRLARGDQADRAAPRACPESSTGDVGALEQDALEDLLVEPVALDVVVATTSALRGSPVMRPISPKKSGALSVATTRVSRGLVVDARADLGGAGGQDVEPVRDRRPGA